MPITDPIYTCPHCPRQFFSKVGRDDHMAYRHADEMVSLAEAAEVTRHHARNAAWEALGLDGAWADDGAIEFPHR